MSVITCMLTIEIPSFNTEFIPDTETSCTNVAVAGMAIKHDGIVCGDNGTCLFDPETGGLTEPWEQDELVCQDHKEELEAHYGFAGLGWHPAVIFRQLETV